MCSFTELTFDKFMKDPSSAKALLRFTKSQLSRMYPKCKFFSPQPNQHFLPCTNGFSPEKKAMGKSHPFSRVQAGLV